MLEIGSLEIKNKVLIGKGGFASVFRFRIEDRVFALKQIDVQLGQFQTLKRLNGFFVKLFRELQVMHRIKSSAESRRLLKYYGFSIKINRFSCLEMSLISDLMKTDLHKYLIQCGNGLSQRRRLELSLQIAEGIEELQRLQIIHSDIKPQNILLNEENEVFIADYGTCLVAKYEQTFISGTVSATLKYAPPELLTNNLLSFKVLFSHSQK